MPTKHLALHNLPRFVEPTVAVLEIQAAKTRDTCMDTDEIPWTRIYRITADALYDTVMPAEAVHVFGDAQDLAACEYLVGYTKDGFLECIMVRPHGKDYFCSMDIPEELTGRTPSLPSVRLVFKTVAERDKFVRRIPESVLQKLAEPVRILDVSSSQQDVG